MTRLQITAGTAAAVFVVLLTLASGRRAVERTLSQGEEPATVTSAVPHSTAEPALETHQGFLFARVTTYEGATYEGRVRFGGDEEAFWGDYFNGFKDENPWIAHVPIEQLRERRSLEIFGFEIAAWERPIDMGRPFMARFGDVARIESNGGDLQVTLKSGTVFLLDRFAADDFADGVRMWDAGGTVVNLAEARIRSIEFLPTARMATAPERLYGTVRTVQGEFTGFVQWDRVGSVGSDEIGGQTADGALRLRFDGIRAIERSTRDSSRVTLLDGREIELSGTRAVGQGHRGVYVDDPRYGRVLVPWEVFERIDFGSPGGAGPAYGDFPPGHPLTGSVTTGDGLRLTGRLVFDLDESETTETLDAPSQGVDYTVLFGLIASITLPASEDPGAGFARVTLHSSEDLSLELTGDLGEGNAGMLVFVDGGEPPEYVSWPEIQRIDFDRPPAMFPALGGS